MKLSIVTINYNNAEGLRKTLASVAAQTYRDIEHIIVDGGSTDGSVDIIKEYVRNVERKNELTNEGIHVVWLSEPDKGIYNAMNKGIEIALGRRIVNSFNRSELVEDKNKGIEIALGRRIVNADHTTSTNSLNANRSTLNESPSDYIQILNSGDILAAPDVTERMMNILNSLNVNSLNDKIGVPILYGNMIRDFGNGKLSKDVCLGDRVAKNPQAQEVEWTMDDFIKGTVNHDPTYIHRSLYEKYGLYDENLKICSDWKWFVNAVVFGGEKLFYIPIDVTIFDTTGISETNLEFREKERHAELEKMLPAAILKDYDNYHFPIAQMKRLKKHHIWGLVYFMERVLFKLEKWHVLH